MNGEDFRSKLREFHLKTQEQGQMEKKVVLEEEKKMINACSLRLYLEDHTVGNLVRMGLLRNKDVTFAGYRQIHPLQHTIEIKVQTNGIIKPFDAIQNTLSGMAEDFKGLEDEWSRKVSEKEKHMMKIEI